MIKNNLYRYEKKFILNILSHSSLDSCPGGTDKPVPTLQIRISRPPISSMDFSIKSFACSGLDTSAEIEWHFNSLVIFLSSLFSLALSNLQFSTIIFKICCDRPE